MKRKIHIFLMAVVLLFWTTGLSLSGPLDDCAEYAKLGVPGNQGDLLCRTGHLLAHSPERKTPYWVIEHLTAEKASAKDIKRRSGFNFKPDPDLEEGKRAELSDYKDGSKLYDRGHMAPAADMGWSKEAMAECFYLSNMIPQSNKMNQVIWSRLEGKVRKWAINRNAVYVFTGPIYEGGILKTIGDNEVAVPSHVYKIVYDPQKKEAIAFIMPNIPLLTKDMPIFITTIREVEEKTGLNFLSKLSKKMQDKIETTKADDLWEE